MAPIITTDDRGATRTPRAVSAKLTEDEAASGRGADAEQHAMGGTTATTLAGGAGGAGGAAGSSTRACASFGGGHHEAHEVPTSSGTTEPPATARAFGLVNDAVSQRRCVVGGVPAIRSK